MPTKVTVSPKAQPTATPPDHPPEVLASMETLWSTLTRYAQAKPAIDAALARCREARAALDESIRALETL